MGNFQKNKKVDSSSMENGVNLISISSPGSVNTEQFNTIRTNIQFSNVDQEYHKIMITSSNVSEGKSTIAANVAASFAKQGVKTLLVDTDLRRPTIKSTFQISTTKGLTNYLSEASFDINSIIFKTTLKNLYVLPSGPIPPNPSELIGSKKMKKFVNRQLDKLDLVLFDAPPLLSVTDAQILSTMVDGTILVVRENYTDKNSVKDSLDLLKHVNGKVIGSILNDTNDESAGYYGYYK